MTDFIDGPRERLAYECVPGDGPVVVFLGGFKSDMRGTKAQHLSDWARQEGRAFLRFDYGGHGESDGAFEDGCIGDWADDARSVITNLTTGPVVLVGSSMGGWISLLLARDMPERLIGLVTIAAAPDFTEKGFWAGFSEDQKRDMLKNGRVELPSDYDDGPYVITQRLIEDGRDHLIMEAPLSLPFPVRMLQGTADMDVPMDWALDLLDHAEGPDIRLNLVKGADHRFSDAACLALTTQSVTEVLHLA